MTETDDTDQGDVAGNAETDDGQEAEGELTGAEAAQAAAEHVNQLVEKEVEGVVSLEPVEDGWVVGVEVVEADRVPSASDILAVYEAEIDLDGGLVACRRVVRYIRGRVNGGGS